MRATALSIAVICITVSFASAADEPSAIVDKAIKAMGGEEKLAKGKAHQWKAKGKMDAMGQKMEFNADYFFVGPEKFRFDVAVDFGGMKMAFTAATDGKVAWEKMGDMLREMADKKAQMFKHQVYTMNLGQLLPLKEKDYTLAIADTVKVDGNEAIGIKVSRKDRPDVTLYFDKKSGLLVKSSTKMWDEFSDKDVTQEVYYQGWKDKNGIKIFDKLVIHRGGKPFIEEELTDQKLLEKPDPKMFAKP